MPTIIVEMHHTDYENLKRAATALGYSNIDMMKLSSHLIATAVNLNKRLVHAPAPLQPQNHLTWQQCRRPSQQIRTQQTCGRSRT